ncbi:MAG: DUF302 domain-containing protein [Rhodobacteraceae bacterium]|jgi:uncharacterized protein (DUF302 family)|nr:DUF302 domain-containing protein [Paracoccaceae bacterium]
MKHLITAAAILLAGLAHAALANDTVTYEVTDQSYDDVMFGLENAILDFGLVISEHNHVGDMLERTKADLGATETIYAYADVFGFCSAPLSRAAMLEDPMNIRFCPYNIYMYQISEESPVIIGYDVYPEGALQDVQALLDDITRSAIGLD